MTEVATRLGCEHRGTSGRASPPSRGRSVRLPCRAPSPSRKSSIVRCTAALGLWPVSSRSPCGDFLKLTLGAGARRVGWLDQWSRNG